MATKVTTISIDDLTEVAGDDVKAREWTIDGVTYTADFSDESWAEFLEATQRFADVAQRVKPARGSKAKGKAHGTGPARRDPEQTKAIREWGRKRGFTVPERGRLPRELVEAYDNAA